MEVEELGVAYAENALRVLLGKGLLDLLVEVSNANEVFFL